MMTIKHTGRALLLAAGLLLASCDNFLDIQPVGQVIPKTLAEYRALFTTAYSTTQNDRGVTEVRTDIASVLQSNQDIIPQNTFGDIEKWNDNNPGPSTRSFGWSSYYTNIYYANAVIDNRDEISEGSREEIDQLVGEAYLMRAYMHFILVNLYGEPYTKADAPQSKAIPLKLDLDLENYLGRNTVEEVYTSIRADIAEARKLMTQKVWEGAHAYRFSQLSTYALESRVALYTGKWQTAYDAAQLLLAEKSELENLNSAEPKLPNLYESVESITAYETILSSDYTSALIVSPTFYQKYEVGKDLRRTLYFTENNGNVFSAKSGALKFKCSFRTGEIYLNLAEAAARLNKLSEARTHLLKLMENRYTPETYLQKSAAVNAMNQEVLTTAILDERALELAFEGHRWFDLRRTTRPEIRKEIAGTTFLLKQDDPRYTLRIPQEAIAANPKLLSE